MTYNDRAHREQFLKITFSGVMSEPNMLLEWETSDEENIGKHKVTYTHRKDHMTLRSLLNKGA